MGDPGGSGKARDTFWEEQIVPFGQSIGHASGSSWQGQEGKLGSDCVDF